MASVVIPTRNRAPLLRRALQSLSVQTVRHADFDVIVVDNGSTDETRGIVDEASRYLPQLRYVYAEAPGLHVGRHAGLCASDAEIVIYADDDVVVSPTWVEGAIAAFADNRIGLVGGRCIPEYEIAPPEWEQFLWSRVHGGRVNGFFSLIDLGDEDRAIPHSLVWGCNFAVRRQLVWDLGGFHPDGFPDDRIRYRGDGESGLAAKIRGAGYAAVYAARASLHHFVPASRMTLDYVRRRAYAQGISDSYSYARAGRAPGIRALAAQVKAGMLAAVAPVAERASSRWSVRRVVAAGYVQGFEFHRSELARDPGLMAWVKQESYLDHGTH